MLADSFITFAGFPGPVANPWVLAAFPCLHRWTVPVLTFMGVRTQCTIAGLGVFNLAGRRREGPPVRHLRQS